MRFFYVLFAIVLFSLGHRLAATAQTLDPGFAPSMLTATGGSVQAMVQQPDGKVIISGQFQLMNGQPTPQVARLNADGSPDLAFRALAGGGPNNLVSALAVQPDGRILLGGSYNGLSSYNGTPVQQLVRLNADGSLDASFGSGGTGWESGEIRCIAVQPDGRILVGGGFDATFNGQPAQGLIRLLPSGALDATFSIGTGFVAIGGDRTVNKLVVQPDGNLVVAGSFSSINGQAQPGIVRLTATGSIDATFRSGLSVQANALALARQPDGRLLVGGLQLAGPSTAPLGLVRLLTSGALDPTFQGVPQNGAVVLDLHVRADGSILVAGSIFNFNGVARGGLARLSSTGALDASFAAGPGANGALLGVAELTNGQYLAGGYFAQVDGQDRDGLTRLTAAGAYDASYPQTLGYVAGGDLTPQTNGQILVHSNFTHFNGQAVSNVGSENFHRINTDGTYNSRLPLPAPTTLPNGGTGSQRFAAQPDGTFYATYQSTDSTLVVRHILAGGTFDPAFAPAILEWHWAGQPSFFQVNNLTALPGGSLLIGGGGFSKVNGQPRPGLARLLANGTLDTSFAPLSPAPWQVAPSPLYSMGPAYTVVQANGQVLVGWDDASRSYLARLNANGTVDNSFSIGTAGGATARFGVLALASSKLLVNGNFTVFGGQAAPQGLARLLPNGAPDPTFTAASASRGTAEQADGRLVIIAPGTNPQNVRVARLSPDGSLDTSFQPVPVTSAVNIPAWPLLYIQPGSNAIVLGGGFTSVAGQPRLGLARLVNTVLAVRNGTTAAPLAEVFPNPAHEQLSVQLPAQPTGPATLADLQGRTVRRWALARTTASLPLHGLAPGVYLLSVPTTLGIVRQRFAVE